jgi:hypothetical protein
MKTKSRFPDRPYGIPSGIPETAYDRWVKALNDLRTHDDPHAAARLFRRCCRLLKDLQEKTVITEAEHNNLRSQLNDAWAEAVNRIEQPGSTYVDDAPNATPQRSG